MPRIFSAFLFLALSLFIHLTPAFAQSDAVFEIRRGGAMSLDEYNNVPKGLLLSPEMAEKYNQPAEPAPVTPADPAPDATTASLPGEEATSQTAPDATTDAPPATPTAETGNLLGYDAILGKYREGNFADILPSLESLVTTKHSGAEELLGIMYRLGQGVDKNPAKSLALLTSAAEEGRPLAAHHLGSGYYSGDIAEQNSVRALTWIYIAIALYPEGAERLQAQKDRDAIFLQLTPEDRDDALAMAREILSARGEAHLLDLR